MSNVAPFTFVAGERGPWSVSGMETVCGEGLAAASALEVRPGLYAAAGGEPWALRGVTSNTRYTTGAEAAALAARQAPLGRRAASRAALIPIRKSAAWWALAQDERRAIYEERSRHTSIGLEYLPAIARRLHHCRDLAFSDQAEPFDFLTWFEFAPAHEAAFDDLLARLRASEEWDYVEREVDVRLTRMGV